MSTTADVHTAAPTVVAIAYEPIKLNYQEKGRRVLVTPEDEDRFGLTVQEAIDACRARDHSYKFTKQFEAMLEVLMTWYHCHDADVDKAFLTVHDSRLLFLVVTKHTAYNAEFEDELTKLDLEIAQNEKYDVVVLNVLALPPVSMQALSSFLTPESTLALPNAHRI